MPFDARHATEKLWPAHSSPLHCFLPLPPTCVSSGATAELQPTAVIPSTEGQFVTVGRTCPDSIGDSLLFYRSS